MVKYLCDNCGKRTRDSDGIYTRCTYMGDVKKRTECNRHMPDTHKSIPRNKISFLDYGEFMEEFAK